MLFLVLGEGVTQLWKIDFYGRDHQKSISTIYILSLIDVEFSTPYYKWINPVIKGRPY